MDLNKYLQILILIIVLGAALRLYNLGAASIKADEGGTVFIAEQPFEKIYANTFYDTQPPLFYFLLHFWIIIFGKMEFILRLLPAIFSILTIPLIYKFGKVFFNEKVGLFSALIFAVSQASIRFAQNLRNYSFITLFALLSVYFFYSYLNNKDKKALALFIISSVVVIWAHYFAAFILIAEFLFLLIYYKKYREIFFKLFFAFIIIAIMFLPLIPLLKGQIASKQSFDAAILEKEQLPPLSLTSLNQNNLFVRLLMIFFHFGVGFLEFNLKSIIFIAVLVAAILVYSTSVFTALRFLFKENKEKLTFLLLSLLAPIAILSALWISGIFSPLTYTRYLLFISPFFYILVGAGLVYGIANLYFLKSDFHKKTILVIFAILILFFNSVSLSNYYSIEPQKESWRTIASQINQKASSEEIVAIYSGSYSYNLMYYLNKEIAIYAPPENLNARSSFFGEVIISSSILISESNSCNVLNLINENTKGVWVVFAIPTPAQRGDLVKQCLGSKLKLAETLSNTYADSRGQKITDILVYHYTNI